MTGSTDQTEKVVQQMQQDNILKIYYEKQENQGKMASINELVKKATGEFLIECDSDDYFMENSFSKIKDASVKVRKNTYAIAFLKQDQNGNNLGKNFQKEKTTMFDLYFKDGENGEKALVFITKIRKNYQYQLEVGERFVTEARMYHQMDLEYHIICENETLMICEYQENGYSKQIEKVFLQNPKGYFEYFKEIFLHNMKGVPLKKRFYVIKHYLLFATLAEKKGIFKEVKGIQNWFLVLFFYLPGKLASQRFKKKKHQELTI